MLPLRLRSVQSAIKGTSVRESRTMLKPDSAPAFVTTAEAFPREEPHDVGLLALDRPSVTNPGCLTIDAYACSVEP